MSDSYRYYMRVNWEEKPIPIATYLDIVNNFMIFIFKQLFSGLDIELPCSMGSMLVRGRPIDPYIDYKGDVKGIAPNWAQTKIYWLKLAEEKGETFEEFIKRPRSERPLMYCFNEHSNGIMYKIAYTNDNKIINKTFYSVTFSRNNKRTLSKMIKDGAEFLIKQKHN